MDIPCGVTDCPMRFGDPSCVGNQESCNQTELVNCILEDSNTSTQKAEYLQVRKIIMRQLEEQEATFSKARKLFVSDILKYDDYSDLKKECKANLECLKKERDDIVNKLKSIDKQRQLANNPFVNILQGHSSFDIADKTSLAILIPPGNLNLQTGDISLELNNALSKILSQTGKPFHRNEFYR